MAQTRPAEGIAAFRTALEVYARPGVSDRKAQDPFEVMSWLADALVASNTTAGRAEARRLYQQARDGLAPLAAAPGASKPLTALLADVERKLAAVSR
jgi:hypothetical protein